MNDDDLGYDEPDEPQSDKCLGCHKWFNNTGNNDGFCPRCSAPEPEGMIDHDEEDRRAYHEELNERRRPSEY